MPTREIGTLHYGEIIRKYRQYQGLSQEELARKVGLHRIHLGKIERGEVSPGTDSLIRIAKVLGVTTAHLVGEVPFLEPWPQEGTLT
jgi:transcriptional regulator with XRE-family HTH domain